MYYRTLVYSCSRALVYSCTRVRVHSCTSALVYECTRVRVHSCTSALVRVLEYEYEYFLSTRTYSSTNQSNRTRTRVHYQSNRTHDYFSRLHFVHMNSCNQIYKNGNIRSNLINVIIIEVYSFCITVELFS